MTRSQYNRGYYEENKEILRAKRRARYASEVQSFRRSPQRPLFPEEEPEPVQPTIQDLETLVAKIIDIHSGKNIVQPTEQAKKPLFNLDTKNIVQCSVVVLFMVANTFFLVHEQTSFWLLQRYSLWQSVFFSLLAESALLLFGYLFSTFQGWRKLVLGGCFLSTFVMISMVILSSVEKKQQVDFRESKQILLVQQEIDSLAEQEKMERQTISGYDAKTHPTIRRQLQEKMQHGTSKKLSNLREKYQGMLAQENTVSSLEGTSMRFFRMLSLVWNAILGLCIPVLLGRILGVKI